MNRKLLPHAWCLSLLLFCIRPILAVDRDDSPPQPNIILILADDLGYGDLGCYGSQVIATPRLDRMEKEGMKFTDFYMAAPFCSPSRAALLTGRLPARCGVPYVLFPAEHTGLPPEEMTLAELVKPAGYVTGCVGKWHLGWRRELRPLRQGFDEYFGLLHTNDVEEWRVGQPFHQLSAFEPLTLRDGDRMVEQPVDQAFLTQKYTARAVDFIRRHHDRPFLLYLAHTMPHVPQYASPTFSGKSRDGVYGDCIEEMDASIGLLLDELQAMGIEKRTLVLFTSDNGANPRNRAKPDANPRFPGQAFGGSNGKLRGGKGSTWEGGIRVPCIAWWPRTIAPGRVESAPCSALDIFPTLAKLAGASLPPETVLDGVDLASLLLGNDRPDQAQPRLLAHYFGVQLQAVREDRWKLVVPVEKPPEEKVPSLWFAHQPGLFERQHRLWPNPTLYDIESDPGEQTNVSREHSEVVSRLLERARSFDISFQSIIAPVLRLPGPAPPAHSQIRKAGDDLTAWHELVK